jgi:hypothetical protein
MFEPLKDPDLFLQVKVDPELETVIWPNGADLAPEFLYHGAQRTRIDRAKPRSYPVVGLAPYRY